MPPWKAAGVLSWALQVLAASGESTYAGDRDRRFLDCAVPCEFECANPSASGRRLPDSGVVRAARDGFYPGYHSNDLGPQGKKAYSKVLQAALQEALGTPRGRSAPAGAAAEAPGSAAVPAESLPLVLRATRWTCEENCRYECMIENRAERRSLGQQEVHYYGKWPFTRVLGVQELFSTLFSLGNGLPYAMLLASWPRVPWSRASVSWALHTCTFVNTWIQSAIFHARESPLTETLDYHGATLGLTVSLCVAIGANLPDHWPLQRYVLAAYGPPVAFWMSHVFYLSFVNFDYGHNMKVAVVLGVIVTLLWLFWAARNWRTKPFAWKLLIAVLGPYTVLPLELLDFPPMWNLLDAHACWHLGTVPMAFSWCSFVRNHMAFKATAGESKKE